MLRGNETMQHFFETVPNIRKTHKENTVAICPHTFPQASVYEIINPVSKHVDRPASKKYDSCTSPYPEPLEWRAAQGSWGPAPCAGIKTPGSSHIAPQKAPAHTSRSKCLHGWPHSIHRISLQCSTLVFNTRRAGV